MSLFVIRSGVQVGASEGSSASSERVATLAGLGAGYGGGGGGALSPLTRTPAGRAAGAAFIGACTKLVVAARGYQAQEVRGGLGTGGPLRVR